LQEVRTYTHVACRQAPIDQCRSIYINCVWIGSLHRSDPWRCGVCWCLLSLQPSPEWQLQRGVLRICQRQGLQECMHGRKQQQWLRRVQLFPVLVHNQMHLWDYDCCCCFCLCYRSDPCLNEPSARSIIPPLWGLQECNSND
jgi:hypothetical protein